MDDFTALFELFKPMFHTMLLIWKHSGHYNTSAKMVTLIREMCNDLIMQACKFVPGMHLSLVVLVSSMVCINSGSHHAMHLSGADDFEQHYLYALRASSSKSMLSGSSFIQLYHTVSCKVLALLLLAFANTTSPLQAQS